MEKIFQQEVSMPDDNILGTLSNIVIAFTPEEPDSNKVEAAVQKIQTHIDDNEVALLDLIGNQMTKLSEDFADLIQTTQDLFAALSQLNNSEDDIVTQKKQNVTRLLKKLETSMAFIRKI